MKTETIEEFLARGGKIRRVTLADADPQDFVPKEIKKQRKWKLWRVRKSSAPKGGL